MSKICIIRHGESKWKRAKKLQGRIDIELSELGREEARIVADHIKGSQWDYIISSPLLRARETGEIIGGVIGINQVILHDGLLERDYGQASGLSKSERHKLFPDKKYPGIESKKDLAERMYNSLLEIVKEYPDKNILIISHGPSISGLLSRITNGKYNDLHTICNCSVTTLNYENSIFEIEKFNEDVL